MSSFTLQPCKLRTNRFVDQKADPLELDWTSLAQKLVPSGSHEGLMNLRRIQIGAYVGLVKHPLNERIINFLFVSPGRTGKIGWLLRKDKDFVNRLVEVYRVTQVQWEHSFVDLPGVAEHA